MNEWYRWFGIECFGVGGEDRDGIVVCNGVAKAQGEE